MSDISNQNSSWSSDIENVLESIRHNSIVLSTEHKKQYLFFQSYLKYFRIPTLILSGINSVASVGLVEYVRQERVSLITCLISLSIGIITSIELYLGIEKHLNNELEKSRDFYLLGIDIYKTLKLKRENRNIDGSTYLEQCLSEYSKLFENSNVLSKNIKDKLTLVDLDFETAISNKPPPSEDTENGLV